ncbi:MAG: TrmH family RNA methyltransferase [Rubrobacter sp.]
MPVPPAVSAKRAAKLNTKKHREAERLFLAEGSVFLEEANGPPTWVFEQEAQVRRVSALRTPTGPVGVFPFLDLSVGELLSRAERIVLLHGVQDPGNVGAVVRSAHAFGAGVAFSRGCADLYNPKTVRATMGSIFHAPVARELDSGNFLEEAGRARFRSVAAVTEAGDAARPLPLGRLVICVGAEGAGLPERVVEACDATVTIPSLAASLNAAVAASILLYEAYSRVIP